MSPNNSTSRGDGEFKIKVIGEAGQGIKLLTSTLSSILTHLGNEVSLIMHYDAQVRGGTIVADLVFSKKKISNPIIDSGDLLLRFYKTKHDFKAKYSIIDDSVFASGLYHADEHFGFESASLSKFGSEKFLNMIILGRILKFLGVDVASLPLESFLPPKFVEKNVEAIGFGYTLGSA